MGTHSQKGETREERRERVLSVRRFVGIFVQREGESWKRGKLLLVKKRPETKGNYLGKKPVDTGMCFDRECRVAGKRNGSQGREVYIF